MTIESVNTLNTTRYQTGQAAGSIDPTDVQVGFDSLAGLAVQTAKTADYTVALTDRGTLIPMNSATAHVFFINTDAVVNFDIGTRIYFGRMGAGTVTITATTPATTKITVAGGGAPLIRSTGCVIYAHKVAANLWWLGGDLGDDQKYNVKNYGAIGDGSAHPASGVYGSLGALQAVYGTTVGGVTIALTNELDWLGTQAAIDAASSGGGTVYSVGSFVYTNSNSVSDGSGTLTFPIADEFTFTNPVSWEGQFGGSRHSWPNDLGTGHFAVLCAGRGGANSSIGLFYGLSIAGPGVGSTMGATSCNMQGIGVNDRRNISLCRITGFRVGINIIGGQCSHTDLYLYKNYYGYYWDNPTAYYGNIQFTRVNVEQNTMSAIGVHHAAQIPYCTFLSCMLGVSPYSVYKETNSGSPTQPIIMGGCIFDNTQFEDFGNACIVDDRTTQAARCTQIYDTRFRNCQFMWDLFNGFSNNISGVNKFSVFDVQYMFQVEWDGFALATQLQPGTVSIWHAQGFVLGVKIRGDISTIITNCTGAVGPRVNNMFSGIWTGASDVVIENTASPRWTGSVCYPVVAAAVGQVMAQDTGGQGNMKVTAGTTADTPTGIMTYNPTPAGTGGLSIYAYSGEGQNTNTTGTVTLGQWVRTAASGVGIAATNSADVTSPMIGYAVSAASGNVAKVRLKGLA